MPSPIDEIFKEIFGYKPVKAGTAYEILAAIATHIFFGGDVKHDDKLRGEHSETLYQLDFHHTSNNKATMGEVKDYSTQNKKVGRGDLQKLGGALNDLKEIDQGTFFSPTGFTGPAKKYADAAEKITGKPITLWELRPSTETDEKGYVKTIVLRMHSTIPQLQIAKWIPHYTPSGRKALNSLLKEDEKILELSLKLDRFYNKGGTEILTTHELMLLGYGEIHLDTAKSHWCIWLPEHYIEINGVLAEIVGLECELPYENDVKEIRITDDSENRIVLIDQDGNIEKFITDKMIRKYKLDEDGNLKKD